MEKIFDKCYDEERALYGSENLYVANCQFDGIADGESALKESSNILVENCFFNLRYPFWHNDELTIAESEMTLNCRAPIWYSKNVQIDRCKINGVKAVRECQGIRLYDSKIVSTEFGWLSSDMKIRRTGIEGEYLMLKSKNIDMEDSAITGKYSFQYVENAIIEKCSFNTKDAFWHSKNVTVRNSVIKGEYLGWYSESLTLENCKIIGTQPLCYCKNLTLIDCEMIDCDLAFEKSEVNATITSSVISIKNPLSGKIILPYHTELIMTDPSSKCEIITQ